MKQLFSILFIFIILTQSVSKIWIVFSFNINHDFIVKYLCEKKDEPKNECDGKCWLKKELAKTDGINSDQVPSTKIELPELNCICQEELWKLKENLPNESLSLKSYSNQIYISDYNADIFHPPEQEIL